MNDAKPNPLISAPELLEALHDPGIRFADVRYFSGEPERGRLEYDQGHVPGAVFVDIDKDLAAPNSRLAFLRAASRYAIERPGAGTEPLPDPAAFAVRMSELGFGDSHFGGGSPGWLELPPGSHQPMAPSSAPRSSGQGPDGMAACAMAATTRPKTPFMVIPRE